MKRGQRMHGAILAVVLVSGVAIVGEASAGSIDSRARFVREQLVQFENQERRRRAVRNNWCHTDYGHLTIRGSRQDRWGFHRRYITIDDSGWFRVAATPSGKVTDGRWEHRHCGFLVKNTFVHRQIQDVGRGIQVVHVRHRKKGRSDYSPGGCSNFYSRVSPAALYLRALVNHLNNEWAKKNEGLVSLDVLSQGAMTGAMTTSRERIARSSSRPPKLLSHWPSHCLP